MQDGSPSKQIWKSTVLMALPSRTHLKSSDF
jgi:hypothetical protein